MRRRARHILAIAWLVLTGLVLEGCSGNPSVSGGVGIHRSSSGNWGTSLSVGVHSHSRRW